MFVHFGGDISVYFIRFDNLFGLNNCLILRNMEGLYVGCVNFIFSGPKSVIEVFFFSFHFSLTLKQGITFKKNQ